VRGWIREDEELDEWGDEYRAEYVFVRPIHFLTEPWDGVSCSL
jgi:hypothetical protein